MKNAIHSLALVTAFATGFAAYGTSAAIGAETSPAAPIPTQEEARAALMSQDPGLQNLDISFAPAPSFVPAGPETTGRASGDAQPGRTDSPPALITAGNVTVAPGPIGSTLQTMPAKYSKRNAILDRVPLVAWPLGLQQDQRKQIYQAIMDDKTPVATNAGDLAPATSLSLEQANQVSPLPSSLGEMPGLSGLGYLKTKDKVLLVRPEMRVVVDEITQS